MLAQSPDLPAIPEGREQPQQWQPLADVVGVAFVQVGARYAPGELLRDLAQSATRQRDRTGAIALRARVIDLVPVASGGF